MTILLGIIGTVTGVLFLLFLVFLICLLQFRKSHGDRMLFKETLYAHRGLHDAQKPENSLPAFKAAKEKGYGMEFDLHLTADGQLLIMHDSSLLRTCGVDMKIPEHSLAELRKHPLKDGSPIPTFKELLTLIDGTVPLLIELKTDRNNGKELVKKTLKELDGYSGKYCIESFDPRVIRQLKKDAPHIYRGQLSDNFLKSRSMPFYMKILLSFMVMNLTAKPDFIAYNIENKSFFPLKLLRFFGADVFFWTVRKPQLLQQCKEEETGCIFENFIP